MKVAARVLCLALGVAVTSLGVPPTVQAEDDKPAAKKRGRAKPEANRRGKKKTRARTEARPAPVEPAEKADKTRETEVSSGSATSAAEAARSAASGVDSEIVKEGATNVKVMSFTGLGIEGRLKSPQLVYFVQRVRAEFDRPSLPHRSFMPELARTTEREPVR